MSFLKKLTNKDKDKEKEKSATSSPRSANTDEALDIPVSERGDEPELDDEPTTGDVTYADLHRSLVAQRLGVLPPLVQKGWGAYTEDDLRGTKIRGPHYDKDKVKVPSGPALYKLAHCDIFQTAKGAERVLNVSKQNDSYVSVMHERRAALADRPEWIQSPLAPSLIINIAFPGPKDSNMNLVMFYERRVPPAETLQKMKESHNSQQPNEYGDETLNGVDIARVRAFDTCLRRFRQGSDSYRDGKLKIIPRVAEGGFIVKKTIGRVPAILGKKLKQMYYIDDAKNSIEIIADIGTSSVAGKIITLVKSKAKSLVVDLTFLLQGDTQDELPESVLGGIRVSHCDLDKIPLYDDNRKANKFPDH